MRQRILLILLGMGLFSCKREDTCLLPQGVSGKAGFYTKDSLDNVTDSVLTAGHFIFQAGDSTYVIQVYKQKSWSFKLSSIHDSTRYIFQSDTSTFNPSTLDTLVFYSDRNPKFVSVACGFQYKFTIRQIRYTTHMIDSVWVVDETVDDNANTQHARILLKTL